MPNALFPAADAGLPKTALRRLFPRAVPPAPDPIFALIDRYKGMLERLDAMPADHAADAFAHDVVDALYTLLGRATSVAGAGALARLLANLGDNGPDPAPWFGDIARVLERLSSHGSR